MSNQANQPNDLTMIHDPMQLDYLMSLRLLPLSGDDINDYHGDKHYLRTCNSVSELQRMIRFLTEAKPDLLQSATRRLEELENQNMPSLPMQEQQQSSQHANLRFSGESSSSTTPVSKKEKERFLMFSRVLLKYVEHKNPQMHREAKTIIKECVHRNRQGEPGFESVTAAMQSRLKDLVGDHYWNRAKAHFVDYMKREHRKQQKNSSRGSESRNYARKGGVTCV